MSRWRERVRLEDGLKLDLNILSNKGLVQPGARCDSTVCWTNLYTGEEIASAMLTADMTGARQGWVRLRLGALDQWIDLQAAPRHFGGVQWYFQIVVTRHECFRFCRAEQLSPKAGTVRQKRRKQEQQARKPRSRCRKNLETHP